MYRNRTFNQGVTIIEVVIVLGILGVLMSIGAMNARPPAERLAANAVQSFVQQSRFEAVRSNRPVVVSYAPETRSLTARRSASSTVVTCTAGGTVTRTLNLSEFGGVTSDADFSLLWLPTGQARACPAGSAPLDVNTGAEFTITGPRTTFTVAVGSGGEVVVR